MYSLKRQRVQFREEFVEQHGVAKDVIPSLNLGDDCDTLKPGLYLSCEDGLLIILLDAKGGFSMKPWHHVTLPVLDRMLGAIGNGYFTKLFLEAGAFSEGFTAEWGEFLVDVIVKHAPTLTELSVAVCDYSHQDATGNTLVLDLVGRYPSIAKLCLEKLGSNNQTLMQQLPPVLPHLTELKLGGYFDDEEAPIVIPGFIGMFRSLRILSVDQCIMQWNPTLFSMNSPSLKHICIDNNELMDVLSAQRLLAVLDQCQSLESIKVNETSVFESIKLPIQDYTNIKSFTWSMPYTDQVQPEDLITAWPHLESITCEGFICTSCPQAMAQRILAAVESHDNLKLFRMPGFFIPKYPGVLINNWIDPTDTDWSKISLDEDTQKDILYKLGVNRANALMGETPTIRRWAVAIAAFCHQPSILAYLLKKGLGDGVEWVPHAIEGVGPSSRLALCHNRTLECMAQYMQEREEEAKCFVASQQALFQAND